LKSNEADGIDNMPAAMLKSLEEEGATKELIRIWKDRYMTGVLLKDFLQSILAI